MKVNKLYGKVCLKNKVFWVCFEWWGYWLPTFRKKNCHLRFRGRGCAWNICVGLFESCRIKCCDEQGCRRRCLLCFEIYKRQAIKVRPYLSCTAHYQGGDRECKVSFCPTLIKLGYWKGNTFSNMTTASLIFAFTSTHIF